MSQKLDKIRNTHFRFVPSPSLRPFHFESLLLRPCKRGQTLLARSAFAGILLTSSMYQYYSIIPCGLSVVSWSCFSSSFQSHAMSADFILAIFTVFLDKLAKHADLAFAKKYINKFSIMRILRRNKDEPVLFTELKS